MITGLILPTQGEILFDGQPVARDPMRYRQRLGYVPEEPHLYPHLTGLEYLEMVGQLRGLERARLAHKIEGFLRRSLIRELAARGKVVLFSSHELDTVERVASRVVILHKGRVAANNTIEQLRALMSLPTLEGIFSQLAVEQDTEAVTRQMIDFMEA